MTRLPVRRSPIGPNVERAAQRERRASRIPIAKARANIARKTAMRAYWTRVHSYADLHNTTPGKARRGAGFSRNERIIRDARSRTGATESVQRVQAERLIRALTRQGLTIGKGKTWRDYVRRRGRR